MPEWSPDIVVDEALARRLIGACFPELQVGELHLLAEGWDNAVWVAEDGLAFRFPQRALGAPGVERGLAALPRLAPLLPVAVPVPTHAGRAVDDYPWPFFAFRLLSGREAALAGLDDEARTRLARALGRFLRRLHGSGAAAVADIALPHDPLGRADPLIRVPRARASLGQVEAAGIAPIPDEADPLLSAAAALPTSTTTVLVHGDLHARHLLVDEGGGLSAVIDWDDLCLADPSVDLSIVWSFLPPEGREAFEDEYGPIGEDTHVRARMLALHLCASISYHAHVEGITPLEREALAGLERAAAG